MKRSTYNSTVSMEVAEEMKNEGVGTGDEVNQFSAASLVEKETALPWTSTPHPED